MIKAKITKIDGDMVYLTSEHNDKLEVNRIDIDFGILEGDSLFLKTESGRYKFRRMEKAEAQDGSPHYYDANWGMRENEYQALDKPVTPQSKSRNYPLYVLVAIVVLFLIIEFFRRNVFIAVI